MFDKIITLEDKDILNEYLHSFDYRASSYSFTSLYMWRESNRFSYEIINGYLCMQGVSHLEIDRDGVDKQETFLFMPLAKEGKYEPESFKATLEVLKDHYLKIEERLCFRLVPYHVIDILEDMMPNAFCYYADRPNYDYIYSSQELIDLKGKKFHGKKNHLNYFLNHYQYTFEPMTSEMAPECMDFIREFNEKKDLPPHEMALLKLEEDAMHDVFYNLEKVGYIGGVIRIDGKIQALTVGGYLSKKIITVHVEKANTDFRGLYQAINNEFCKHFANTHRYINREEDMDIPGLRKAKLSYNPVKLLEQYIVTIRGFSCPDEFEKLVKAKEIRKIEEETPL